ncbi:PTS system, IIA component [Liquorilactobacillus sucicola DSM 21376 = JCM 15457]|uniref:PTS system, glucitol sorbitol-specific IIA component n=1 Tax=Liquorilactobacillus sucicola DSM 21376 = JCM 15457 TaxID=1423806 RepID=A0A023CVQ8_9LACO|nr:PTS glucitol/sorbitol transporter subunit IIA [Liquorilactobacillus sucicola]KRN06021.1 PTS system, glucitol sorbitol-specific IIA component [Liquorilactobacillus sucicola DSM 21376 = JCM 15457]GAJ25947.1 PTS system, IIA component [Liquorilactobacillus sucicola DSM 21376 = JCM 15457]
MLKAEVVEIGPEAISKNDPLLILFDETASTKLRRVSIVQRFSKSGDANYDIAAGNKISIDDQEYEVVYAGQLVKSNMEMIGHATLCFSEVPETPQHNGIYLKPFDFPKIHVGSIIKYY